MTDQHVTNLIREAEDGLASVDPGPFSPQAFELLRAKVSSYVRELIVESSKVARRRKVDLISARHVEIASDYLGSGTIKSWWRHVGTIGGILLGASISNFLAMASTEQFPANGVLLSAGLAVVGAFGVALHIGRE